MLPRFYICSGISAACAIKLPKREQTIVRVFFFLLVCIAALHKATHPGSYLKIQPKTNRPLVCYGLVMKYALRWSPCEDFLLMFYT